MTYRRLDTRRTRILLLAGSIVISALGGGLALWWLWPTPPPGITSEFSFYDQWGRPISARVGGLKLMLDPATIYANFPGQRTATFTVDADGYRGTPRRPGRPQLAVLGGSGAFGWLLPSDRATFAWLLAERLEGYDVVNAGVIGFQSGQELSQMVHRLDNPRMAAYVVYDGWNDLFDHIGEATVQRPEPVLGFNNTFLLIQDRLWEFHRSQGARSAERGRLAPPRLPNMPMDEYVAIITATYLRNLDRMHAFARAREARFLLVLQPDISSKPQLSAEERHVLATWDTAKRYVQSGFPVRYAAMRRAALEFCAARRIPCMDVAAEPGFQAEGANLFIDTVHLNERGQKMVAELIERRLRDPR